MITLAQGGGGKAGNDLIAEEILPRFGNGLLANLPDAATLPGNLVFSTDSFVVTPQFFPGGDIGKLAVCGTVNDIYMAGGVPKFISLALILEEGFSRRKLGEILDSVKRTADECLIQVVTGDTKVVPKGAADGVYINTAGIGIVEKQLNLGRGRIEVGDSVLVSGSIGEHGMAVLAARHGIGGGILSDCAPLGPLFRAALEADAGAIKFMRDPTRGGVGGVLQEIAGGSGFGIEIGEVSLPFSDGAKAVAGMLGIELLYSACEGRMVMVAGKEGAQTILKKWHEAGYTDAAIIGTVNAEAGRVTVRGEWGGRRLMILPEGDQLPRIC